jgi:protein O-mannosyl-transferase
MVPPAQPRQASRGAAQRAGDARGGEAARRDGDAPAQPGRGATLAGGASLAGGATLAAGATLVIATLLAHLPALRAGWLWDDDVLVLDALVREPGAGGLAGLWAGRAAQEYLPLTGTLHWLQFRLWGDSAAGFHAVALLLHAAAVLAVWRVLVAWRRLASQRLAEREPGAWRSAWGSAWWGALLFGVHPLGVASVAWVSETKTLLALLLAALSARAWVAWLSGRSRRALLIAWLGFVLALLAKSALVTLPAVLLVLAWWHARGADGAREAGTPPEERLPRRDVLASIPFFAGSLVLGLVTVHVQHSRTLGAGLAGSESLWLRLAAAGRSVWWYAGKALLPVDLTVVYERWPVDPSRVTAWLPLAALLAALALLLRARRRSLRAAGAGLAAFTLLLLPALGLIEMSFMAIARVSDHFAYPALPVPCALAALGVAELAGRARGLRPALVAAGAVVVLALGAASFTRARLYGSQATLFADNVARVPEAWLAHNNLGAALLAAGDARDAEAHLRRAIALHAGYAEPRANLGALLLDAGRLAEAREELEAAVALAPELAGAHANLGRLEFAEGRLEPAAAALRRALALDPQQAATHNALGAVLASGGAREDAERCFRRALELRPGFAEALDNLARLRAPR